MTKEDVAAFAETLHDHCQNCKHTKEGWGPAGCKRPECWFHTIRLLAERVRRDGRELDRILAYRQTK